MKTDNYDSRNDTIEHAIRVRELLIPLIEELDDRSREHDASKTQPPELAFFDEYTPKLRHSTYGSPEYHQLLVEMQAGLEHHYANNRHHPEHHEEGIDGMTLIDLVEMLADWKAATERHEDGNLERSLKINKDRFEMSDQLVAILESTARHFGWL